MFFHTDLSHTDLTRTDLTAAMMVEVDLKSANMTGAQTDGLIDRRSFWCSTIGSNGTLRNDSCQGGGED